MAAKIMAAMGAGALGLLLSLPQARAQEVTPLRGEMFLAGKTVVDPPPEEPKASHAYMTVTGVSALRMYRAMTVREVRDECQPGRRIKRAGPLACSITGNGRDAACDFSVDLLKGALAEGRAC